MKTGSPRPLPLLALTLVTLVGSGCRPTDYADRDRATTHGPKAGEVGGSCTTDDDCGSDARCLAGVVGASRTCSPRCTPDTMEVACHPLIDNSWLVKVPENLSVNNYHTDLLWRAVACVDPAEHDLGAADGHRYCVFVCPENAGAVLGEDGSITSCMCLPNFTDVDDGKGMDCRWDPSVECSLFVGCTAQNTEIDECSAGDFRCALNDNLEGICLDWETDQQIEECVARCDWDCDPNCLRDVCTDASVMDACSRACCHSTTPGCD